MPQVGLFDDEMLTSFELLTSNEKINESYQRVKKLNVILKSK